MTLVDEQIQITEPAEGIRQARIPPVPDSVTPATELPGRERRPSTETNWLPYYDKLSRSHWWLTSKYVVLRSLLRRYTENGTTLSPMLDVGCAGGVFLRILRDLPGRQFGLDRDYDILHMLRSDEGQDIPIAAGDAMELPYHDESFALVSAIDILEHLEDDNQGLREFHRILKPGGWLLLSVPAFMALYGRHDELFGHYRRYRRGLLRRQIEAAGFSITKATYIQPLFFVPLWLKRRFLPVKDQFLGDFSVPHPAVNRILHSILAAERLLLRYLSFPVGATLIFLARK